MRDETARIRWPRWLPWVVVACAILALYRLGHDILIEMGRVVQPVLVPLLLALAFAYLLEPLVEWLQHRLRLGHQTAVLVAIVVGGIILGISILFLIPPVVAQLIESAQKLPQAVLSAVTWLEPYLARLRDHYPTAYETAKQRFLAYVQTLPGEQSIVARAAGQVVGVTANILNLILIPVFTFYILRDLHRLRRGIERLIPLKFRARTSHLFDRTGRVASDFVRGQLTVAVILSVLYTTGFWIARVPLALSLGVLAGFGYLIPYIGTFVAVILTLLLVLLTRPGWWPVISVLVVYLIVQTLEGFLITPRILGDRLKLHPMLVIIGLIIGGSLFGILGVVLALPALALLKVVLETLLESYFASPYSNLSDQVSAVSDQPKDVRT